MPDYSEMNRYGNLDCKSVENAVKQRENQFSEKWDRKLRFGVTEARAGLCVRALAKTAQDIEELFADLAEKLELDR